MLFVADNIYTEGDTDHMHPLRSLRALRPFEIVLWCASCTLILISFLVAQAGFLSLFASLIGVSALIFIAKGDALGQFLTVIFALLYGFISMQSHFWGEMITYCFMSLPMAIAAAVSWLRHPSVNGTNEVEIRQLTKKQWYVLFLFTAAVTAAFCFVLYLLNTPLLVVSTISIATSFSAAALTFLRSPFYAIAYAANDIVLIILWSLQAMRSPGDEPLILCFVAFLCNDAYGFYNWRRMERRQLVLRQIKNAQTNNVV